MFLTQWKFNRAINALHAHLNRMEKAMSVEFDALKAEVGVAVSDIKALVDKLASIPADDSAAIAELTAQLKTATDAADAVLNPPAAPAA